MITTFISVKTSLMANITKIATIRNFMMKTRMTGGLLTVESV